LSFEKCFDIDAKKIAIEILTGHVLVQLKKISNPSNLSFFANFAFFDKTLTNREKLKFQ